MKKWLSLTLLGVILTVTHAPLHAKNVSNEIQSLKKTSQAFNFVAEKNIPAVVNISTVKTVNKVTTNKNPFSDMFNEPFPNRRRRGRGSVPYKQHGLGSGVLVDKRGYILTNNHVIENVDKITVTLSDKREFKAILVGADPKTDLAVLKIEGENLPFATLGDSDILKVGDWAIAVGSPFGLNGTVTVGIISAKGRSDVDIVDYTDLIQTDAAINPGNSGGALLNIEGEVIGINTAIYSKNGGYIGIGFAVPINVAKKVMNDIILNGKVVRGWLGVVIQPITNELQKKMNLNTKEGALISDVIENSPAEKSGLKRGDVVIIFNGKKVASFKQLRSLVGGLNIGDKVDITFLRNNLRETTSAIIDAPAGPQTTYFNKDPLGIRVIPISPKQQERMKFSSPEGAFINEVAPRSPAANAGLKEGDVILEMNYSPVRSVEDYLYEIKRVQNNERVLLVVRNSEGYTRFIVVKLGRK